VVFPVEGPNGIGLSPDLGTLYWAETQNGRVHRRTVVGLGELAPTIPFDLSGVLCGLPGMQYLDSLAVDGGGWVCAATLFNGGITAISPDGTQIEHHATGDLMTTNICFGGDDLRTAYVTLSSTGRLVSFPWPRPGLRLAHQ
jgi:gluconolactonase